MTTAKFKVFEKVHRTGGQEVKLQPVTGDYGENKEFFKWTPYGTIQMGLINDKTADFFELDAEYYVEFKKV